MRKQLVFALLIFLGYNIALDSVLADCHDMADALPCHTCICQTHMTDHSISTPRENAPSPTQRMVSTGPRVPQRLFDKSVFHPPKASA